MPLICDSCRAELFQGESFFGMDGKAMCSGCFRGWILDLLDTSPRMLAEMVGAHLENQ